MRPVASPALEQQINEWNTAVQETEDDDLEDAQIEYTVRVSRRAHGSESFSVNEETDVVVVAANEDEAEQLALRRVSFGEVDWEEVGDRNYHDTDWYDPDRVEVTGVEEV